MSFMDGLGKFMGEALARMQDVQQYQSEYESMTDYELKKEYMDLKGKTGMEAANRRVAVTMVLKSRGYGN